MSQSPRRQLRSKLWSLMLGTLVLSACEAGTLDGQSDPLDLFAMGANTSQAERCDKYLRACNGEFAACTASCQATLCQRYAEQCQGTAQQDGAPAQQDAGAPPPPPQADAGAPPPPAPDSATPPAPPASDSGTPPPPPAPDAGTPPAPDASPTPPPPPGNSLGPNTKAVLLHHSVGFGVYSAGSAAGKGMVNWVNTYNASHSTSYQLDEIYFPAGTGSGNHPVDYWNIWVNGGGSGDPTLETLTQSHDVIIFKHCFFSCFLQPDTGNPDISASGSASALRLENYKLQYQALKQKLLQFPNKRFIVWTQPVCVQRPDFPADMAQRAKDWVTWVKNVWDTPGDNIYLWDFNQLETQGGLYAVNINTNPEQCHPGKSFNESVQPYFGTRIVDVIEGRGDGSSLTGQ